MERWAKNSDFIFFILYQIIGALILPLILSIYYKKKVLFLAYYRGLINGVSMVINDF